VPWNGIVKNITLKPTRTSYILKMSLTTKLANMQLCVRAHYHATRKNIESRMQVDKPIERASGGDPLLLYKILHLLFFPLL